MLGSDRFPKVTTRDFEHSYHTGTPIEYGTWDLRWSGWRTAVNAIVRSGFWIAHDVQSGRIVVSTVGGVVQTVHHEHMPIDLQVTDEIKRQYPSFMLLTAKDESDLAKAALSKLVEELKRIS